MIKLQTKIKIKDIEKAIHYQQKIMALGSCFVENIGTRLERLKYNLVINPFGIQYNPTVIAQGLNDLLDNKSYEIEDLLKHQELWHSLDHHGSFSAKDSDQVLEAINQRLVHAQQHLQETDVLFVTLGTAWVFENKKTAKVVNNCHKLPATDFNRYRLSVKIIVEQLATALSRLYQKRPGIQVVFTVSPIRHLKDGASENQLSKSTLLLAIDELKQIFPQIYYFPAYELMMDELRDYRFYARDLTHPNDLAIDYIWARFEETCLLKTEQTLRNKIDKLLQSLEHRPIHIETLQHKDHIEKLLKEFELLDKTNSYLNFEGEMRYLSSQIDAIKLRIL